MSVENILDKVKPDNDITQTMKIGDILVDAVTDIRVTLRKEVIRRPVQAGFSVDVGIEVEVDIVLASPEYSIENLLDAGFGNSSLTLTTTWQEKRDQLLSYFSEKTIVDCTTHEASYSPLVVAEVTQRYDSEENLDGWIGTVRMVEFDNRGGTSQVSVSSANTAATVSAGSL